MFNVPFFPSLRPPIANRRVDSKPEETEVLRYERDYRKWLESMKNTANDLNPLGKVESADRGAETDDEDANDSEDTDSHEDEDDDTNPNPPVPERSGIDDINLSAT